MATAAAMRTPRPESQLPAPPEPGGLGCSVSAAAEAEREGQAAAAAAGGLQPDAGALKSFSFGLAASARAVHVHVKASAKGTAPGAAACRATAGRREKAWATAVLLAAPLLQVLLWGIVPYHLLPEAWAIPVFACAACSATLLVNVFMALALRWAPREAPAKSAASNAAVASVLLLGMRLLAAAVPGFRRLPLIGTLIAFLWILGVVLCLAFFSALAFRRRGPPVAPAPAPAGDLGAEGGPSTSRGSRAGERRASPASSGSLHAQLAGDGVAIGVDAHGAASTSGSRSASSLAAAGRGTRTRPTSSFRKLLSVAPMAGRGRLPPLRSQVHPARAPGPLDVCGAPATPPAAPSPRPSHAPHANGVPGHGDEDGRLAGRTPAAGPVRITVTPLALAPRADADRDADSPSRPASRSRSDLGGASPSPRPPLALGPAPLELRAPRRRERPLAAPLGLPLGPPGPPAGLRAPRRRRRPRRRPRRAGALEPPPLAIVSGLAPAGDSEGPTPAPAGASAAAAGSASVSRAGTPGAGRGEGAWPPERPLRFVVVFGVFLASLNFTVYFQFSYVALFAAYSAQPTAQVVINLAFNAAFFLLSLAILRAFRDFLAGLLPAGQAPLIVASWLMYMHKSFRFALSFRAGDPAVLAASVLTEVAVLGAPLLARLFARRFVLRLLREIASLLLGRHRSGPKRASSTPAPRDRLGPGGDLEEELPLARAFAAEAGYSVFLIQSLISILASVHFLVWLAACRYGPARFLWPYGPAVLSEQQAAAIAGAACASILVVALAWLAAGLYFRAAARRPARGPDPDAEAPPATELDAPLELELPMGATAWGFLVANKWSLACMFVNGSVIAYGAAHRYCAVLSYYFPGAYEGDQT
eukprot:tig00020961_g16622.t1